VRSRRPSYTLLELLLVMAVLLLLMGMAYPSIDSMYANLRLRAAADDVRAAWAQARSRAIDEGRPYRFAIIPNQANYRVAPDGSDFWNGNDPPQQDPSHPTFVLEKSLPRGIRFSGGDNSGGTGWQGGNFPGAAPTQGTQQGGGSSSQSSGNSDPSAYVPTAIFLPDGTANQGIQANQDNNSYIDVTFQAGRGRPVILRLRTLTGAVTVLR
jgi:type II secretory pathway pseudopilin PulG